MRRHEKIIFGIAVAIYLAALVFSQLYTPPPEPCEEEVVLVVERGREMKFTIYPDAWKK